MHGIKSRYRENMLMTRNKGRKINAINAISYENSLSLWYALTHNKIRSGVTP